MTSNRASKDFPMVHAARLRRLAIAIRVARRAALSIILLMSQGATADQVFTVNSVLDQPNDLSIPGACHTAANTCTLRAAIMQANRATGSDATIVLPAGLYTLTILPTGIDGEDSGDLNLTAPASGNPVISIVGSGAATTIIDANYLDRVLNVALGRTASISGVTIRNGYAYPSNGGGIRNDGSLTLSKTTISGNQGQDGGGILDNHALTVVESTIIQNTASGNGGGIQSAGNLNVRQSTISANNATVGGGIVTTLGLTMLNSTVSDNHGYIGGGGIENAGSMFVVNSTITRNDTYRDGGGIFNAGTANVYNTTIAFNGADVDGDGVGVAGGVFNYSGRVFNLRNTLVAGNNTRAPFFGYLDDCAGVLTGYGANLFRAVLVSSGCTVNGSWGTLNLLNLLGPLQDNGGPTQTHALLTGSNAIDGGDPFQGCVDYNSIPITTDQRGALRVTGARCDIGAFEVPEPEFALMLGCGALGLTGMKRKLRGRNGIGRGGVPRGGSTRLGG